MGIPGVPAHKSTLMTLAAIEHLCGPHLCSTKHSAQVGRKLQTNEHLRAADSAIIHIFKSVLLSAVPLSARHC